MKTLKMLCVAAIGAAILTGCGLGLPLTNNQNSLQTNVVLQKNNYKVVKTITGEATATYIFGIGGLSKKSLKEDATAVMIKNAKLDGKAQAIVNTQVTLRNAFITPFYIKSIATAQAQVIEFIE